MLAVDIAETTVSDEIKLVEVHFSSSPGEKKEKE